MTHASGYFRTTYGQDTRLVDTRTQRVVAGAFFCALIALPWLANPFVLDLANQTLLAVVGAVALMLLTGFAGQISLGHAGLMAAGAFCTGILSKELGASIWLTLPASAATGALLGVIFGLPSLRLRGLYLAVSTLALHFIVIYLGHEYETRRGFSTGIVIDPPRLFGWELVDGRAWYVVFLIAAVGTVLIALNWLRSRTGRAWRALHGREAVAEALGIDVPRYKLLAFVASSTLTAMLGCLFAYYRGFVSVEAFSLFLSIQYVAMVIIGGMGSIARRGARRGVRDPVSLRHRRLVGLVSEALPEMRGLQNAVRDQLCRVRPGDDLVSGVRAARAWSASGSACRPTSCCGRSSIDRCRERANE